MSNNNLLMSSFHFGRVIFSLVRSKPFMTLTLLGNLLILSISFILYFIENQTNPMINNYLDAVWWGFATATNVGYGDVVPQSVLGKIIGIGLMLLGTALFAIYTALFAQALLEDDYFNLKNHLKKDGGREKN